MHPRLRPALPRPSPCSLRIQKHLKPNPGARPPPPLPPRPSPCSLRMFSSSSTCSGCERSRTSASVGGPELGGRGRLWQRQQIVAIHSSSSSHHPTIASSTSTSSQRWQGGRYIKAREEVALQQDVCVCVGGGEQVCISSRFTWACPLIPHLFCPLLPLSPPLPLTCSAPGTAAPHL